MAEEIDFENGRFSNFEGLVTLTLTFDPAIRHTVVHHSSTSTYIPTFIQIEETFCGRTDVRTDGRTGRHFFPLILLGRLFEVDLIIIQMLMLMVLSSWQNHCESSPGLPGSDECRTAPSGRRPKTKPNDLGYESACRLSESTPTITIYYYYSAQKLTLILPSSRG